MRTAKKRPSYKEISLQQNGIARMAMPFCCLKEKCRRFRADCGGGTGKESISIGPGDGQAFSRFEAD